MEGKEIVEVLCEIDFGTVLLLLFVFWEITGVKASSFFFSFFACFLHSHSSNTTRIASMMIYGIIVALLLCFFLRSKYFSSPLLVRSFFEGGPSSLFYFTIRVGERLWALSLLSHTASSSSHSGCRHTTQEVRRRSSHVCPSVSAHSLKQR